MTKCEFSLCRIWIRFGVPWCPTRRRGSFPISSKREPAQYRPVLWLLSRAPSVVLRSSLVQCIRIQMCLFCLGLYCIFGCFVQLICTELVGEERTTSVGWIVLDNRHRSSKKANRTKEKSELAWGLIKAQQFTTTNLQSNPHHTYVLSFFFFSLISTIGWAYLQGREFRL